LSTSQNKAIKLIGNGRYREHVTPYYRKFKYFKIVSHYETAKYMHLVLKDNSPQKFKY